MNAPPHRVFGSLVARMCLFVKGLVRKVIVLALLHGRNYLGGRVQINLSIERRTKNGVRSTKTGFGTSIASQASVLIKKISNEYRTTIAFGGKTCIRTNGAQTIPESSKERERKTRFKHTNALLCYETPRAFYHG